MASNAPNPPVSSGIFSFAGDSLFVQSSGKNLHRRATAPELKAHFDDPAADRPAHWYEAQLIHYGLPSSRVKGTAKMRLFDAVRGGGLAVPGYMKTMEADLKKRWKAQAKQGRQPTARSAADPPATQATPASRKRKQDAQPDTTPAKAARTNVASTPRQKQTARRGGTAASRGGTARSTAAAAPTAASETSARKPQMARRGGTVAPRGGAARSSATSAPPAASQAPARKAQTARRGGTSAARGGSARNATAAEPAAAQTPERKPQTARRGARTARGIPKLESIPIAPPAGAAPERKPQMARRGGARRAPANPSPPRYEDDDVQEVHGYFPSPGIRDDSFSNYGDEEDGYLRDEDDFAGDEDDHLDDGGFVDEQDDSIGDDGYVSYENNHMDVDDDRGSPLPLGLLNGRYEVHDPRNPSAAQSLVLTLDGDRLWAYLEMEAFNAMFHVDRPYQAGDGNMGVTSRCRFYDEHGVYRFYDGCRPAPCQHINFRGGGQVEGKVRFGHAREDYVGFFGRRLGGEQTWSEISPWEMRARWEDMVPAYA